MKYYIYVIAACLLLSIATGISIAIDSPVIITVPSSFTLSDQGMAIDDGSNEYAPGPGPIMFFRNGKALYVRVPAPAGNGTRLVSLEDRESGIVFRNNTMLLPVCSSGERAGSLVATTGNLSAESDGYAGQVTGLELDLQAISAARNGMNYTAGAIVLLKDLPAGGEYLISFGDNDTVEKAIAAGLEGKNRTIAAMSPTMSIGGTSRASEDAVDYVIVTVRADGDWPGPHDAGNTSMYWYNDSGLTGLQPQLSELRTQIVRTENGTAYQAITPGPGQFALVAAGPRDARTEATAPAPGDVQILGLALAVLLVALAAMVRRVARR